MFGKSDKGISHMTMTATGNISLGGVAAGYSIEYEIAGQTGSAASANSLNDVQVRNLAQVQTGAIVMPTDFYGKDYYSGTFVTTAGVYSAPAPTALVESGWLNLGGTNNTGLYNFGNTNGNGANVNVGVYGNTTTGTWGAPGKLKGAFFQGGAQGQALNHYVYISGNTVSTIVVKSVKVNNTILLTNSKTGNGYYNCDGYFAANDYTQYSCNQLASHPFSSNGILNSGAKYALSIGT